MPLLSEAVQVETGGRGAPFVSERSCVTAPALALALALAPIWLRLRLRLWLCRFLAGDAEVGLRQCCCYGCGGSGACHTPEELDGAGSGIAPRNLT